MIALLQLAAAFYLAAAVAGGVGLGLPAPAALRYGQRLLAAGAALHAASFVALHRVEPTPQLTELPMAVSLMAGMAVLAFFVLARRARLEGLMVLMGPLAFLGVFFAALRIPHAEGQSLVGAGWPHAHVLLASAGFALLALAAVAGAAFLAENRRLKAKRPGAVGREARLPSLEALDGVNAVALSVGFPLLTLGVLTGMMWTQGISGRPWTGTPHQTWTVVAWAVYALLVVARFAAGQGGRSAAASAVGGFLLLLVAVVGVGIAA